MGASSLTPARLFKKLNQMPQVVDEPEELLEWNFANEFLDLVITDTKFKKRLLLETIAGWPAIKHLVQDRWRDIDTFLGGGLRAENAFELSLLVYLNMPRIPWVRETIRSKLLEMLAAGHLHPDRYARLAYPAVASASTDLDFATAVLAHSPARLNHFKTKFSVYRQGWDKDVYHTSKTANQLVAATELLIDDLFAERWLAAQLSFEEGEAAKGLTPSILKTLYPHQYGLGYAGYYVAHSSVKGTRLHPMIPIAA